MSSGGRDLPQGFWAVQFRRGADSRVVVMEYPMQNYYTDAELTALEYHPPVKEHAPAFREEECGGAFDGFVVTSDADPGL